MQTILAATIDDNSLPCLPANVDVAASSSPLPHSSTSPSHHIAAHMLELQLPRPMPHALPREPPFDFYASASRSMRKLDATMQLPYPRITNGHDLDSLRTAPRATPLTPPGLPGSAVRVVSLPANQGAGHHYGYQLPAIGNSRTVTAPRSPSPQRQQSQQAQPSQDVIQTPRKRYSISPNLRIPSTISAPQDGLPQLAAEVSTPVFHPRVLANFSR